MDASGQSIIRKMESLATAVKTAHEAGAQAYANGLGAGGARKRPIVAAHFTAGNQGRYGWAALSHEYFMRKQGDVKGRTIAGNVQVHGATRVKLDKHAQSREISAPNAPMLVLTGRLRQAVTEKAHPVTVTPNGATVHFTGLPEYAAYLEDGTSKMPRRSPVHPNEDDRAQVVAVMRRHIDKYLGTQGIVPVATALEDAGARQA